MSTDEARELLGLAPTSNFDQAMKARDKRLERYRDDPEKSMQVCHRRCCMQHGSKAAKMRCGDQHNCLMKRWQCKTCRRQWLLCISLCKEASSVLEDLQVETAYDVLLMDNMKRRLSGEAAVAKSVRFADVPKPRKKAQVGVERQGSWEEE
jgi:Protein CHAPERONE-LIKE PROTEIN OF POR1-like